MRPPVQWVTASPLWDTAMHDPLLMQRPALLRFDSDSFMDDLAALLEREPAGLGQQVATVASFREPPTGAPPDWTPTLDALKLYQPAHGHFNLVAASLVCRLTGLPDRAVNGAHGDKVGFVLRRLAATGEEMAWVTDRGQAGVKGWQPLTPDTYRAVASGEQLLPLFPMIFTLAGRRRRLLVGLIPTASREAFQAGPALSPFVADVDATGAAKDPRLDDARTRVIDRLQDLKTTTLPPTSPPADPGVGHDSLVKLQAESASFILLDLATLLSQDLPVVWQAVLAGTPPATGDADIALYSLLAGAVVDQEAPVSPTWAVALQAVWQERDAITGESGAPPSTLAYGLHYTDLDPAVLLDRLEQALHGPGATRLVPPAPPSLPKLDPGAGALYVLRCAFQQPQCGPSQPDVVSDATEPFALASFFDFDAPSRPIRISLPIDTSVSGLRKFHKNVSFIMSKEPENQIAKATDMNQLLKGELASGGGIQLGFICSFSIPIITICAMIVLMIFINLLNIVFWWKPFLQICFPIISPKPRNP